ncbi:MAG: RNA polymerase sigma factor [Terriglobales bacterium]
MNLHLTVQVPRSPDLNQVIDRFQRKLDALLLAFQPELVQLQGRLARHTQREGVRCRLNLHLPTGQLSSDEAAATAQAAFRAASDELTRQLKRHKQRLRETRPRARLAARRQPAIPGPAGARVGGAGLAGYFGSHHQHLLGFVQRQLELRERLGELPPGWLDPREVLDETVVMALTARPGTPSLNRGRWLLLLATQAIRRLAQEYGDRQHGQELHSLDQAAPGGMAYRTTESDTGDGQGARLRDLVASDGANPEEAAQAFEAMERLAAALVRLPRQERHDLVLYLLEGFRPQEIAQLSKRSETEVRQSLDQAEAALRALPELPLLLRHRLGQDAALQPRRRSPASRATSLAPQRA